MRSKGYSYDIREEGRQRRLSRREQRELSRSEASAVTRNVVTGALFSFGLFTGLVTSPWMLLGMLVAAGAVVLYKD